MSSRSAVLVLAGGRSRRMGQDKSRLPFEGSTLLDWQKQRLAELGLPVYHSGPDGIPDDLPGFPGPLAGMLSAARAQPDIDLWLVMPVDMPQVSPALLKPLLESAERERRPVAYEGYPLPLALPVYEAMIAQLRAWLTDPDGPRSIRHLHKTFNGLWQTAPQAEDELINLNTPDDWWRYTTTAGDSA